MNDFKKRPYLLKQSFIDVKGTHIIKWRKERQIIMKTTIHHMQQHLSLALLHFCIP